MAYCNFANVLQFVVVYVSYGSSYLLRTPYGIVKNDLLIYYNIHLKSLGYIDMGFLLPYAIVSLAMSGIVDYFGARLILSLCLFFSGIAGFLLPFCSSYEMFVMVTVVNGAFQALCWPSACAIIAHISENNTKSSSVFGLFGTSCFVGGILGKFLAVWLKTNLSLAYVFIIPSLFVMFCSISILASVKSIPFSKAGTKSADVEVDLNQEIRLKNQESRTESRTTTFSFYRTLKLPGVLEVSLTMFFVKCVRYMFIFWLPLYLVRAFQYTSSKAGYISIAFDVGGIIGSIFIGHVSDTFLKGRDMFVCVLSIVGSTISLILFWIFPSLNCSTHVAFLIWIGGMYGGADILLCGSVAAKLGKRYKNESSITLITGLVNGIGSLGTVLEGPIIAYFSAEFGWDSVLLLIFVFSAIASLFAIKANVHMVSHVFRS